MLNNKKVLGLIGLLLLGGWFLMNKSLVGNTSIKSDNVFDNRKEKIVIYKSPTCGCCVGYVAYLEKQGFEVEVVNEENLSSVKDELNIPYDMQSCHTAVIGDYFIEGHVPVESINKLLSEKPDIDGIALPDMPAGSPGMPGVKGEEFVIYSLTAEEEREFVRL